MTTSASDYAPEEFHSLVSGELQRQGNIQRWAGEAKTRLHMDSAVAGTLRQFPGATKLLVAFDQNGGQVRPVGVAGPNGTLDTEGDAWATRELPHTPGRSIHDDLAHLDAEYVARLHLPTYSDHVFAIDLTKKYYKKIDKSPLDRPVYEGT